MEQERDMRKKVALLAGGFSGESEVSMKSAKTILANLDPEHFDSRLVQVRKEGWYVLEEGNDLVFDLNRFSYMKDGEEQVFDYAYIIIHGAPGEDGKIQGYLDMMDIPYSTGSVLNMALTFNKAATQKLMINHGVRVAEHITFRAADRPSASEIAEKLGLPCFVKPTESGSSIGVSKVKELSGMDTAIDYALEISNEVIVERMLEGKELACGVFKLDGEITVLPVTEIVATGEFFDYEAKYEDEATQEITPARIPESAYLECQELSKKAFEITDCDGIARADFFLSGEELYLVEINTIPGMSAESLVPKQLNTAGIDLKEILTKKILGDLKRQRK